MAFRTFLVLIGNSINQHAGFKGKAIEGSSDDTSGTWIRLKFFLEQVAFDTQIDPIPAYSALNRRRDQQHEDSLQVYEH
ncbi:hypothetical protein V1478_002204 [Vespula squamosa]|uniref:Uncharacterized protein n=1 Tax=Vespula squamosa TaxID=30214 RepID=A0ABD2BAL3_VESSQ